MSTLRPLSYVPRRVFAMLAAALVLQALLHLSKPALTPSARALPPPPSLAAARLASLGDTPTAAKLMMLRLQSHDDQPGIGIGWNQLDYLRVREWLARILDLDPRAQYPLLAASQVYAAAGDPRRVRLMLDFVHRRFAEDPNRRWPWLAHAALVAHHRLHDPGLARTYAQAIRTQAGAAPDWARQLEIFILEDMNELDSARALIGGLIDSGTVVDPRELAFLDQRLKQIAARQKRGQP